MQSYFDLLAQSVEHLTFNQGCLLYTSIYMADYATGNADEIAMFQVKESDQVTVVKSLINDRIKDLKVRYEDYKPEEMTKLDSAVVEEKGNYIFVVISPDNEKAKEILKERCV